MKHLNYLIGGKRLGKIDKMIPLLELNVGDWIWFCGRSLAAHVQVSSIQKHPGNGIITLNYHRGFMNQESIHIIPKYMDDDYTCVGATKDYVITTDEYVFLKFKGERSPRIPINEYPLK